MKKSLVILCTVGLLIVATKRGHSQEFYYDLNSVYEVTPSNEWIAVQFDSTYPQPQLETFAAGHACLDAGDSIAYLHRGFWLFGLATNCGYPTALTELGSDPLVYRVLPVYVTTADGAVFKVSDLIDVQFEEQLSTDSCIALLSLLGLHIVDSSEYRHNLWEVALDDSIRESPLWYGNMLHTLPETEWACARQYDAPELQFDPPDPYFVHEWHLKNTGQNGGLPDNDIDADSAWEFATYPVPFSVAILDDGFTTHIDMPDERLSNGEDFAEVDYDPTPWFFHAHGMACMGLLAATVGDTGVAGVAGNSWIIPVRIIGYNTYADTNDVADAIRFAGSRARVISNSWGYGRTTPIAAVANAIRDISNQCPSVKRMDPQVPPGSVMIFAAGNYAENSGIPGSPHIDPVVFPANMPEVIAVGAIDNQANRWDYSCYGGSLDLVAPSGTDLDGIGNESLASSLWTVDQMGNLGWNPSVTGIFPEETDDVDYTAVMGGTSGACPQVAGVAAMLMSRGHSDILYCNPGPVIREILTKSAEPLGDTLLFGHGRLNAYRAMLSIVRGDVNNDFWTDALDVNLLVDIVFFGQTPVLDRRIGDLDCNGFADATDVAFLIDQVYFGGPTPGICFNYQ